jgi:hypothetical protein
MSSYPRDTTFDITPVKNPGKSKERKGNVPPKTYVVPNLINEGSYVNTKVSNTNSGGPGTVGKAEYKPAVAANTALGQGVQYVGVKKPGKSSISELPGQYTGVPKSGGK